MKNYYLSLIFLVIFATFLSGCTQKVNDGAINILSNPELENKNQEVVLSGLLTHPGDLYLITTNSGKIQDLESYTINFDDYVGKNVEVTGEYSGNTLFVTEIK